MKRIMAAGAACVAAVAASVTLGSTAASAAACEQGTGVSVVLGSSVTCVKHTGGNAAGNFSAAGITLEQVQRQPGMICKVDGLPKDAGCLNSPPADAYWGLFWSDGTSGSWTYSTLGVTALNVPKGGWVSFVFQNSDNRVAPSVKPLAPAPKPTAKPKATAAPATSAAPQPTATVAPTPSATTPTPQAKKSKATPGPTASPSAGAPMSVDDQSAEAQMVDASADDDGSGTLGWVAGGAGALLLTAGIGTTAWRRRGDGGHS
jgi:cell division septation protein DedD